MTLTIPEQPKPIVKKGTIDLIDPGETKTITFTDFPEVPFGEKTTVQVSVKPVPGEQNTDNNSAEYPVVFSLEPHERERSLSPSSLRRWPALAVVVTLVDLAPAARVRRAQTAILGGSSARRRRLRRLAAGPHRRPASAPSTRSPPA